MAGWWLDEIVLLLLSLIWMWPLCCSWLLNYTVCFSCGRIIVNTLFPVSVHPDLSLATICRTFGNGELEKLDMWMRHLRGNKTDTKNPLKEENEKRKMLRRPIVGSFMPRTNRNHAWSGKLNPSMSLPKSQSNWKFAEVQNFLALLIWSKYW